MKKFKIVNDVMESKLYQKDDDDFGQTDPEEIENAKYEYYHGDLWYDCDYILKNGEEIWAVMVDGEIILNNDCFMVDLTPEDEKLIIAFYDDEKFKKAKASGQFIELSTWDQDIKESHDAMQSASLAIRYRGGSGYHYGWWILKK